MYLFMDVVWFVESVGYASLMTEACLAVPQLFQNYRTHSTIGMSATMVLLWAGGDLFKTGYFVIKQVPMQFIVCGIIQVTVDLLILAQVALYPSDKKKKKDKKKDVPAPVSSSSSAAGQKELKAWSLRTAKRDNHPQIRPVCYINLFHTPNSHTHTLIHSYHNSERKKEIPTSWSSILAM